MRIGLNEFDHRIVLTLFKQQRERPEKFSPDQGFEPWPLRCLCSAPPVELSGNWEQVATWVDYKPVDVEIDDDNTGIFHVFEMRMNEWIWPSGFF